MNLPDGGNDNLYKHITMFGTFLVCSAVVIFGLRVDTHDERFVEVVEKNFIERAPTEEVSKFWNNYLEVQKQNTEFVARFCGGVFGIGLLLTITGAILWYRRIQRFKDQELNPTNRVQDDGQNLAEEKPKIADTSSIDSDQAA